MSMSTKGAMELWDAVAKQSSAASGASVPYGNRAETKSLMTSLQIRAEGIGVPVTGQEKLELLGRVSAITNLLKEWGSQMDALGHELQDLPTK